MLKALSLLTALVLFCAAAPTFAKDGGAPGKATVVSKASKAVPAAIASKAKAPKAILAAKGKTSAPKQGLSKSNYSGKSCVKGMRGASGKKGVRNAGRGHKAGMKHQRR